MRKIKNFVMATAGAIVLAVNSFPSLSSAALSAYNRYMTFSEAYNNSYTGTYENLGTGVELEIGQTCKLESTNKVTTKMSTFSGDLKEVYAYEWDSNGKIQFDSNVGSIASITAVANPLFFTPVRTSHTFESKSAEVMVCVYYN